MPELERFSMERCLKPNNFGAVRSTVSLTPVRLVMVKYLTLEWKTRGDIHCAFLIGKARVAPVKTMTIPRLELSAATLSFRVVEMINRELHASVDSRHYWTDSTTVLKYIRNERSVFKCLLPTAFRRYVTRQTPSSGSMLSPEGIQQTMLPVVLTVRSYPHSVVGLQ